MRDLKLPSVYDSIVRRPEHWVDLREAGGVGKRLHVSKVDGGAVGRAYEGSWRWAVVLRAVSGWKVIAAGVAETMLPETHVGMAEALAGECRGESGDGFDRLPRTLFTQIGNSTEAHIRRDDPATTYCGRGNGRDAVFDTRVKGHAVQHCSECDVVYRAEHYGRTPVSY
ncbi:hypothetical protein [Streptomyces sp. NPDC059278]|uniref:hypothetical protein n=1 Tax=Streptomyces sp. NPDC059278 TaxID=3346801 RepID=UPI0036A6691A